MTSLELIFTVCALVAGVVFLVRMLLFLDGVGDGVGEFDGDFGDGDGVSGLSIQGITAFFMMFGLVGLATMRSGGSPILAIGAGAVAGMFSLWASTQLYRFFRRLQSRGNASLESAIGKDATVYLSIPERGVGQIQVTVGGRLRTHDARAEKGGSFSTGDRVRVTRVTEGNVFLVESAD
jgi:membrane protein implicated in regulation of membrane protease activity